MNKVNENILTKNLIRLIIFVVSLFFAFIWWAVTRMTDEDYDMEKGISRAFRANKKCPRCMNDLPSLATTKCPHCTAELTGDL